MRASGEPTDDTSEDADIPEARGLPARIAAAHEQIQQLEEIAVL